MTTLEQLKAFLLDQGESEEQIAQTIATILKSSSLLLFTNAMSVLSEEEVAQIEAFQSEDEAQQKIKELYLQKTGQDPAAEHEAYLKKSVQEYIAMYRKVE